MAASPHNRTPKSGLLRKWILLPERKKLVVVAVLSVLGFAMFKAVFFQPPQHSFSVSHALTQDEKAALEDKIRDRLRAAHEDELQRMADETQERIDALRQMVSDELEKKEADEALIAKLKQDMSSLATETKTKTEAKKAEFTENLDNVVSAELAQAQKELIESRADQMLSWFCSLELDSEDMPTAVTEQVIDLGEQPCIGVASEGDPAAPVRRFSMSSPDVARTVAAQALMSLRNRTGDAHNEMYTLNKLALSQYDPRQSDRCCDSFMFGIHPVFGMFYKLRLPLVDIQGADSADNHFTRSVCFRRKFHPRPQVKALTKKSKVEHLTHPDQLVAPVSAAGRSLKEAAAPAAGTFPSGTVHVIVPFRGQRLDIFPSLIKNFGRIKQVADGRDSTPFRIIVAPVSWDTGGAVTDAKERMEAMAAAASEALGLSIDIAEPLSEEEMTKEKLVDLILPWIDTSKKLLKTIKLSQNADPAAAGVLPNPWLAAVGGALKLVPSMRAPVLLLDSATYSLPNNLIKKTLWRIVNGRVIYSPIVSSVAFPIEVGYLLSDGGVSKTEQELEESGESAMYTDATWWQDVEDISRFMGLDDGNADTGAAAAGEGEGEGEGAGSGTAAEAGSTRRRFLRHMSPTARRAALQAARDAARMAAAGGSRRKLLEAADESAAAAAAPAPDADAAADGESQDVPHTGYDEEDDDYLGDLDPYGGTITDYLADLEDEAKEWDAWDPDLVESENAGYGLGDEFAEDDETPHNYFFNEDSYDDYDNLYDPMGDEETELLQKRVTTLGATKSDIASMIFRVLETKSLSSAELLALPQGDNCLMLRMVSEAQRNKYRVVRTVVPNLYVDKAEPALGAGDPEEYPCECDYDTKARHCRLVLAQTEVDDPIDETRVNCVITSMLTAEQSKAATKEHDGVLHDLDVAKLVKVTHAVRFIKPSKGVEIIAKVLKADPEQRRRVADVPSGPVSPEVFAFQWALSNKIRTLDDITA